MKRRPWADEQGVLDYTGASFTCSLQTGSRYDHLPRHLGNISARLFGFIAILDAAIMSSRHLGVIKTVLETRLSVIMLVEVGQSLSEKVAR